MFYSLVNHKNAKAPIEQRLTRPESQKLEWFHTSVNIERALFHISTSSGTENESAVRSIAIGYTGDLRPCTTTHTMANLDTFCEQNVTIMRLYNNRVMQFWDPDVRTLHALYLSGLPHTCDLPIDTLGSAQFQRDMLL